MPVFDYRFEVDASLEQVRDFHDSPEVLRRLTPPPSRVEVHEFGRMQEGMIARFSISMGPVTIHWTARHEDVSEHGFTDVQLQGPLADWRHTHRFLPQAPQRTQVWEHIEYRHSAGWKGLATRLLFGRPALWFLFRYREQVTRRALR